MTDFDKTKLIEDFHRNKLKGDDKNQFNEQLKKDPSFKQEVDGYASIFKGLDGLHADNFQRELAQMESKYQDNVVSMNTPVRSINRLYGVAAAIALLICAAIAFNFMQQDVFNQHFQASMSIGVHLESTRGDESMPDEEQIKKRAFAAYSQKDYAKTILLLKDYINNYPNLAAVDYQSILVLGVAQLASGEAQKSLKNFDVVIQSKNSSYKQEAEWMWVMAMFKLEKGNETKPMLEQIIQQDGHIYFDKAKEVLSNL